MKESTFDAVVLDRDATTNVAHVNPTTITFNPRAGKSKLRDRQNSIALTTQKCKPRISALTIPVSRNQQSIVVENIRATHKTRRKEIRARINEFREVWRNGSDARLWEELVYCIFTAGASARMGFKAVDAVRPLLIDGDAREMTAALVAAGAHRFPVARPGYIVVTRSYLQEHCDMALRRKLESFADPVARRDWLAQEKQVKGLGYKEASHYLRNIGLSGYAILDKHVMNCLLELRVVDTAKPPATRRRYLEVEEKLRLFANDIGIDFDELDLVLWSMKTGEVLK